MSLVASKRAIAAAREVLKTSPEAYSLPLGLVPTASGNQLLTLAALLVLWVQARERVPAEAAVKLLQGDYVFEAIMLAAAERAEVPA